MAGTSQTKTIRKRLYSFANGIASQFSDSRRRRFVGEMIQGLVSAGHVHLTAIARGTSKGGGNIHAAEKRLSRNLSSEHWNAGPLAAELLRRSAAFVSDDTLIVADTTDLAKPHARHLEGLGKVHDGSDPNGRICRGYCVFEAHARVGGWQMFPLVVEPLKTYSGAPTTENAELLGHMLRVHEATGRKGTWVLDRGFDRRKLFGPLVQQGVAFVVRQRGDRTVQTADGRTRILNEVVAEHPCPKPKRWPTHGVTKTFEVQLPEVGAEPFLVVIHWKRPQSETPLILLVSPAARKAGRLGRWFVRAYIKRWGVEDATRGIKQLFAVEGFLVRSWMAIRRLLWLVSWAFWWLNLWGDERFAGLRRALLDHPWRVAGTIVYEFNWIGRMLRELLHPQPRLKELTG